MKKTMKILSLVLIVATIAAVGVYLTACDKVNEFEDNVGGEFVVATNAAFAPFEYVEGDKFVGIDMEIAQIIADGLGKKLVVKNMDFDSVVTSVGKNGVDVAMAGLTVTEARKEVVNFTESYFNASQKLIVLENDTTFDSATTGEAVEQIIKALSGKIGVQSGTTGHLYIDGDEDWEFEGFANIEVKAYDNAGQAVQDMKNGNLLAVCVDDAPAKFLVDSVAGIKLVDVALTEEEYAFAVDKNQPELRVKINVIMRTLKSIGKLDEIIEKYYAAAE